MREVEDFDPNVLALFLRKAKAEGFASKKWEEEEDGSYSTRFEEGGLSFHDNWVGGEPFEGRERVSRKPGSPEQKPVPFWVMQYFGEETEPIKGLTDFLFTALQAIPEEMPLRGPRDFQSGDFSYVNSWEGNLSSFHGRETISFQGREVYNADYRGGLINQRKDM